MTVWPPTHASSDASNSTWTFADLQHGDLIFSVRSNGPLAIAGRIAGEPWRHVGAVSRDATGEWAVLETNGDHFMHRNLHEFIDCYESIGVARPDLPQSCIDEATKWMHDRIASGADHIYAWDDLILAGLIVAKSTRITGARREQMRSALAAAAAAAKERSEHRGTMSLTCSAFVQIAYESTTGDCSIEHPRWRSESSWPPRYDSLDALFDGPVELFEDAFQDTTLLELYLRGETIERSSAGSRAQPGQVAELMRVLVHALNGWATHDDNEPVERIGSDGRWVTPGDLWESPTLMCLASLEREEALAQLGLGS